MQQVLGQEIMSTIITMATVITVTMDPWWQPRMACFWAWSLGTCFVPSLGVCPFSAPLQSTRWRWLKFNVVSRPRNASMHRFWVESSGGKNLATTYKNSCILGDKFSLQFSNERLITIIFSFFEAREKYGNFHAIKNPLVRHLLLKRKYLSLVNFVRLSKSKYYPASNLIWFFFGML